MCQRCNFMGNDVSLSARLSTALIETLVAKLVAKMSNANHLTIRPTAFQITDSFERQSILNDRTFAASLDRIDLNDAQTYGCAIHHALERHEVSPTAIADAFGVSRGTISRWAAGKSAPHPALRKTIIGWLQATILERANDRERGLERG